MFKRATKKKLKLRMAIDGPAGSGKTYTGLRFAFALAGSTGRVAVIDSEHRSAAKYQGESPDGIKFDFDVCEMDHYAPSTYTQVIREAGRQGYDVLVVDSLSHAWEGVGGALEQVDKKAEKTGNSFTAWKDVTPMHREMVEAILASPCHVICTMRSKMDYILEEVTNKAGKKVMQPKKVGMAPIQRQGVEYEFDVVADMDIDHTLTISKSRCPAIDGVKAVKPGAPFIQPLTAWLGEGVEDERIVQPAEEEAAIEEVVVLPPPVEAKVEGNESEQSTKKAGVRLNGKKSTADKSSASTSEPCGDVMAGRIKQAAQTAGVPAAKLKEVLARHGCSKLAELPYTEAQSLLNKLEPAAQEAAAPF